MSNTNNFKKHKKIYCVTVLAASILCILARLLSIIFFYDSDIGYYRTGAVLPVIANLLPALAAIAFAVIAMLPLFKADTTCAKYSVAERACAAVCAMTLVSYGVSYALSLADLFAYGTALTATNAIYVLSCLLSVAFFLYITIATSPKSSVKVITGIGLIAFSVMLLGTSYFDNTVQMNAPNKTAFHFACLSVMLLALQEMRAEMNERKPRAHIFCLSAAIVFCGTSSVPSLICKLLGRMPTNYTLVIPDIILLSVFIFSAVRLCFFCFTKDDGCVADISQKSADIAEPADCGSSNNEQI